MTNIEAKSIVRAFDRIQRAAKEREQHLISERAYRGVRMEKPAAVEVKPSGVELIYRGISYIVSGR